MALTADPRTEPTIDAAALRATAADLAAGLDRLTAWLTARLAATPPALRAEMRALADETHRGIARAAITAGPTMAGSRAMRARSAAQIRVGAAAKLAQVERRVHGLPAPGDASLPALAYELAHNVAALRLVADAINGGEAADA